MMASALIPTGVFINVPTHVSGDVWLESRNQHQIVRLLIARSPGRARAAAARASTAAQTTEVHAPRS
jgi:hypothetical protein